jgi:sulfur carrier protein
MNVYINSTAHEFTDGAKITTALEHLNLASAKGIAIAINSNVIPRHDWDNYILQPEDKMMLIRATQGG